MPSTKLTSEANAWGILGRHFQDGIINGPTVDEVAAALTSIGITRLFKHQEDDLSWQMACDSFVYILTTHRHHKLSPDIWAEFLKVGRNDHENSASSQVLINAITSLVAGAQTVPVREWLQIYSIEAFLVAIDRITPQLEGPIPQLRTGDTFYRGVKTLDVPKVEEVWRELNIQLARLRIERGLRGSKQTS